MTACVVATGLAIWAAASVPAGIVIGRAIRRADDNELHAQSPVRTAPLDPAVAVLTSKSRRR